MNPFEIKIKNHHALIQNNHISQVEKKALTKNPTARELSILRHKGLSESRIQQKCHDLTRSYAAFLKKPKRIKFVQIDNGGKMEVGLRMRKAREGTIKGYPDVLIQAFNGKDLKTWGVEFKKIGSMSQIIGKKEHFERQLGMLEELSEMGIVTYMTNNIAFFEEVILVEVMDFIKLN